MTEKQHRLIERIHANSQPVVIVVTGGGASAISDLLSVPGGSRTLLEAVVPYSEAALADWLGKSPDHFCVEETALAMAAVAFERANKLAQTLEAKKSQAEQAGRSYQPKSIDESPAPGTADPRDSLAVSRSSANPANRPIGIACTASLVSDRPKKGDHRCHVATQTGSETRAWSLVLSKGARNRMGEEQLVGHLLLYALANATGLGDVSQLELQPDESIVEHRAAADPLLIELLTGKRTVVWSCPSPDTHAMANVHGIVCARLATFAPPLGLLCGSFHPLHFGHEQLRAAAERQLGGPVYYEMSIRNVDKPPLDFLSIERRRAQFAEWPLALTAAPTFAEKAAALPGAVFVMGVDTAERIVEPRYYQGSAAALHAALSQVRKAGCRFLVAGRKAGERFETLADVALPKEFADLFDDIAPDEFRADVSSRELRRRER